MPRPPDTPQEDAHSRTRPVEPPGIASSPKILDRFRARTRAHGLVGEERNAAIVYLAITSRLLDQQVSVGVKGHSASGKSYTVATVVKFFPEDTVIEFTGMSERALVYSKRDIRHRTLVVYEATALREGVEDNQTAYFVRSLLSEGCIKYEVTVRDRKSGGWTTKVIERPGPTNLVFTTTQTRVHAENETRVLSLNTNDSTDQTQRVLRELANEGASADVPDEWLDLQRWLADAEHRVTIPYAGVLADLIPPVAVRLRRDFGLLLALIRSHAMLHQLNRERDAEGRIVATIEDYEEVRDLVADVIAAGVEHTVPKVVRKAVEAVWDLRKKEQDQRTYQTVTTRAVAERLDIDRSNAARRLHRAEEDGYIRNEELRPGRQAKWLRGEPMPEDRELLPMPVTLERECARARSPEGVSEPPDRDWAEAEAVHDLGGDDWEPDDEEETYPALEADESEDDDEEEEDFQEPAAHLSNSAGEAIRQAVARKKNKATSNGRAERKTQSRRR